MFRRKTWLSLTALSIGSALRLLSAAPGTLLRGVGSGASRQRFERHWAERAGASGAVAFPSARSATTALLVARGIGRGDEVLVTGFTCLAVAEAVVASGATPVWVDIDPLRFSMSPEGAAAAVGSRTRAMIIQHTYGIPAETVPLIELAQKNGLYVIEDAALALGSASPEGPLGSFGDASVYSFEVSKRISAGWGGLAQININMGSVEQRLREIRDRAGGLSRREAAQRLVHAGLSRVALSPRAPAVLGYGMVGLTRLGILHDSETYTAPSGSELTVPDKYYAAQAGQHGSELDRQLKQLDRITVRARTISDRYVSVLRERGVAVPEAWTGPGVNMIRFPVLCSSPDLLLNGLRDAGVEGGRWFDYAISPRPTDPAVYNYQPGSCPRGERAGRQIVNLPLHTRLNDRDVDMVCAALDGFLSIRDGESEFMVAAMSGDPDQIQRG